MTIYTRLYHHWRTERRLARARRWLLAALAIATAAGVSMLNAMQRGWSPLW